MISYVITAIVMVASGIVQTTSGLPGGVISVMFLPSVTGSIVTAGALTTICVSWCTIFLFWKFRKYAKPRETVIPLLGYAVSMPLASKFALGPFEPFLKLALGATLVMLSIYFAKYNGKVHIEATKRNGFIAGIAGGIFSGLFSIGSVPIVIYFVSAFNNKEEYMGTTQFYFLFTSAYSTIVRIYLGAITWSTVTLSIPGLAGSVVGMLLGAKIIRAIKVDAMRKIAYYAIGICGVWMVAAYVI